MGCKQSKGAVLKDTFPGVETFPSSPAATGSFSDISPSSRSKKNTRGEKLYHEILAAVDSGDPQIWEKIVRVCDKAPKSAAYCDPTTRDNSLHVACRALCSSPIQDAQSTTSPVHAVRALITCSAALVSSENANGHIPLHDAIRQRSEGASVHHQQQIVDLLIQTDKHSSFKYLSRNDIVCNDTDGACTAIYHALSGLPDDFMQPPGPTADFISTIHYANPKAASLKNASNHDKPLSLLYRRFSRQFDLSEKFFPGDNSRKEVLEHRHKYKTAAMNTWKIILTILDPSGDRELGASDFFMVHAAVRMDCPPDLLRYIIETRPEEVQQTDHAGRLPLHIAAAVKSDGSDAYHFKFVIDELLYSYPDGAAYTDANDKLPIELAAESEKPWIGGGFKSIYDCFPDGMGRVPLDTYPELQRAMSFSSNFVEERGTVNEDSNGISGVEKEESYDAIMMVQKANSDLGDIVSAMWANEEDGGVQMLGCASITQLAMNNARITNNLHAVALISVTAIVNAMKNHPNEMAVQEKACQALKYLSPADNYQEVSFAASGAAASIVAAMQAHVSDAIVQKEACAALHNIVKHGGSDRATVIASLSGFTALQNALGAHPDNASVQLEACLALEALTSFPDANLPDLPGSATDKLLEDASERFPEEVKVIADKVLSRLASWSV